MTSYNIFLHSTKEIKKAIEYVNSQQHRKKGFKCCVRDERECNICLESFCHKDELDYCDQCKKIFHYKCFYKWLSINPTCPMCRHSYKI